MLLSVGDPGTAMCACVLLSTELAHTGVRMAARACVLLSGSSAPSGARMRASVGVLGTQRRAHACFCLLETAGDRTKGRVGRDFKSLG